ncbi:MAG: hypothetical protein CVT64_08785 [Actinobacteria bacterium HGW-Actinobacteria-4]|nr:MAG: hypothetical protein CVT64_08785 [Actinobacteria bacterium HGW-Actinobacteria-4]
MTSADGSGVERVLVLDDDAMVGTILLTHITALGHVGRYTDDPEEFLALQRSWSPTKVVIDLVMDKMDGLEVLNRLALDECVAAVIISSGMGGRVMDAARRLADGHGLVIAGLLPKPYKRADLVALLASNPATTVQAPPAGVEDTPWWSPSEFAPAFREALADAQISVAYQPKLSCEDGAVVGFEALARWTHDEHGNIPPSVFVPMAERTGTIALLSEVVLKDALEWFHLNGSAACERMAVNISAAELSEPGLDQRILRSCHAAEVSPENVILELTETSAMDDAVQSLQLLTRLRLEGFHLSLDDFGTGYSSMVQLARMPFTELKVDRSFVMQASRSEEAVIVIRSVIDLGHALGMQCTAEGVEDSAVLDMLQELGCDYAQGYYLAKPMYPAALAAWRQQPSRSAAR